MKFTLGINIPTFQHLIVNRLNMNNVEKALKKHIIHL
ncbi:hypothetical protein SAMN05216273_11086 [Chryseobacterium taihuense]|uniref:Transposase n=1 Tax=Chryseobacterium taihuense TaxID=1141221 RepID=A0ABY0QW56_9FLAO|nr:hypothetical protein SAMN05216273_11086 [Chryseobacterium taihuense]